MRMNLRRVMPVLALIGLALASAVPAAAAGSGKTAGRTTTTYGSAPDGTHELVSRSEQSFGGRLYHVAAVSKDDIWAVGLSNAGSSLLVHWNGRHWSQYPENDGDFLFGISTLSATDAWAVGGSNWFSPVSTVAYRWDGRVWTRVPTPTPDGNAYFNAVKVTSAGNAWAVGLIGPGGPGLTGHDVPLIEHWNGRSWKQQTFPLPNRSGWFSGVAAAGPDDAWAVGGTSIHAPNSALIEHWNGHRWRRVDTPPGVGSLQGVKMISRDDGWAVGYTSSTRRPYQSLTMHWNGKRWSVVPSPDPNGGTLLIGVGASGPDDVWAVGSTTCAPQCQEAMFHWNGKRWSVLTPPNPGGLDVLEGVVALTPRNAWAVGTIGWRSTIILHWNGRSWS
jgi:hypothetical protein